MNPHAGSVIFSPTRPDNSDNTFQYPAITTASIANNLDTSHTSPSKLAHNKILPEEMPMLTSGTSGGANSDSDTEPTPSLSKFGATASPAKSYSGLNYRNVVNSAKDNYVNVPSTIINMENSRFNTKDAVSNPGYVMVGKVNETRT